MSARLAAPVLVLCAALALPACTADKVLIVSGESLVSLGDQFTAVADAMDKALESKAITPERYRKWKAFGLKFQEAYPMAVKLWQVASDHRDQQLLSQVGVMVAQMGLDLGAYAALVGVK